MLKKSLLISALAIVAIAFTSCTKEGPEGPAGKDATLKGSIIGKVTLYDEFGTEITDKSGVTVTIDGASPAVTATTDATGKWTVNNISTGTYDLIFSKTGYGMEKYSSFSFVGGVKPTYEDASLSQISNTVVTEFDTLLKNGNLYLTYKLANPNAGNKYMYIAVFYSTSPDVSLTNYMESEINYYSGEVGYNEKYHYDFSDKFPAGTKVYMVAYGSPKRNSQYHDYSTGKDVFPCLNATKSNVISYTIPVSNK